DDDAHNCEETGKHQREFYHELNKLDSAALCLSGGGIRSAAFSLGVIQALASHQMGAGAAPPPAHGTTLPPPSHGAAPQQAAALTPPPGHGAASEVTPKDGPRPENSLLAQFHYLSTVSGGGYIGSSLSAWP